jgi:predicted nuclease of predicted toxin-antitoxin system
MRFKIDENLPDEASELLSQSGHDAITVLAQRMGGGSDPTLARVCAAEGRTLVTLDLDFADIRVYPPAEYSGFIVLRPLSQAKEHVLALLREVTARLPADGLTGQLWVADETGVRIRR